MREQEKVDIAAVIEEVLEKEESESQDIFLTRDKNTEKPHPEVPSLEHIKLVVPDYDAKKITPSDIQKFLEDEEFSMNLLAHDSIPESVKEFFRTQRSPALEAVIPAQPSVQPVKNTIGSSKALTIKDILLGLSPLDLDEVEYISNPEPVDDEDLMHDAHRRKVKCVPRNDTEAYNSTVRPEVTILNSTELMDRLGSKNESNNHCALVLFYAPWCVFSAKAAPHFNALARVFPQLDVFAINAAHFSK